MSAPLPVAATLRIANQNAQLYTEVIRQRDALRAKLDKIRDYCINQVDGDSKGDEQWSAVIAYIDNEIGANL